MNSVKNLYWGAGIFDSMSQVTSGLAKKSQADFQASQLEANAKASKAKGTRDAEEERRRGDIILSNARAAMAGSGGVTTDAGAIETLAGIQNETDYNSLATLYEGDERATSLRTAASAKKYEGKIARTRGITGSIGSMLQRYSKYKKRSI